MTISSVSAVLKNEKNKKNQEDHRLLALKNTMDCEILFNVNTEKFSKFNQLCSILSPLQVL